MQPIKDSLMVKDLGIRGGLLKECKSCAFAFFSYPCAAWATTMSLRYQLRVTELRWLGLVEPTSIIAAFICIPTQSVEKKVIQFFPGYINWMSF